MECPAGQSTGIGPPRGGISGSLEVAGSREIVAADRFIREICVLRHGWNAGPARRRSDALRFHKCTQHRQRQIGVAGFDRLIQPVRQVALARQRAIPFTIVVGEAADLPLRQLQIDQRERCVGPGLRLDQLCDTGGPGILIGGRQAPASRVDDIGEEFGGDIAGIAELVTEVSGDLSF